MPSEAPVPQSIAVAKEILNVAVGKWNAYPGLCWGVTAEIDNDRFDCFVQIADRVFDGVWLPIAPGPFKRLGAYTVAVQYFSPYVWKKDGQPMDAGERHYWEPRIAVWSLPLLGGILRLNGEPLRTPIAFPTLHSQIEVVAFLRKLYNSAHDMTGNIAIDELAERITAMGLLIETSAYASFPNPDRLSDITKHAKNCVNSYLETDPRWPDLFFMNKDFLEAAASFGVE